MYDTLLVIFLNEAAFIKDLTDFVTVYLTTILLRCAIVSVIAALIVLLLRATILKRTVFLKGAVWSLFILVPFFGRLRIYFEGMKQSIKICLPFFLCQEIAISCPWVRIFYFSVIFLLLIYRCYTYVRMKKLLRNTVEVMRSDTYQGNMCQNPSGMILKNPAKYGKEIADAISLPELCGKKVCITEMDVSPCAIGLLNPRIVIPKVMTEKLSKEQLKTVMLHEKTHIRLGHLWIFFAWEIFASILWINPMLMLMEKRLRSDMEQICDRVTIQQSGYEPEEYGKLILKSSIWFRPNTNGLPAMLTGEGVFRDIKERFEKIRDYSPYNRRKVAAGVAVFIAALSLAFVFIRYESHVKYEILPDVVVGDGYGRTYADYDVAAQNGAFLRTEDGIMIDAEKLREILPEDFPRNRYVYFYYDIVMKIPGIGGGGEVGWLEDVPETGIYPLTVSERTPKSSFALWVMKVI